MRISSLEEYGLRCMLALARKGPRGQLSIADIAEMEGLSVPYASKLLAILRKAKLVTAVRGRGGGFRVARETSEINLYEVLTALGGPLIDPDHCQKFSGQLEECVHRDDCSVHHVLDSLASFIGEMMERTTLEDLVKRSAEPRYGRPKLVPTEALTNEAPGEPEPDDKNEDDDHLGYRQQSI